MKLSSTRDLAGLRVVLKDPQSLGPNPAYFVFDEVSREKWFNNTILAAGRFGDEFNKTLGHYHPENAALETYKLIFGQGVFIMQKKHSQNGILAPGVVDSVYIVEMEVGDEVIIKPEWGHALINLGDLPLITFDDWKLGHTPQDYEPIEKAHGMAYYLITEAGKVKAVPNPNYRNLPEAKWISAQRFNSLT